MHIAVIAADPSIAAFFDLSGFNTLRLHPSNVSSLTKLLFEHPDLTALVIEDTDTSWWSVSHILAAAKQLERRGPTILLGNGKQRQQCYNSKLLHFIDRKEEALAILRPPQKSGSGGYGINIAPKEKPPKAIPPDHQKQAAIRPMKIPAGRILMLGVVGSQHRIGCTTQAIGLWHYCRTLGFDPAVISSSDRISEIASVMNCAEIDSGYLIEGIPFVTDAAQAYDCYILDIGTGSISEALKATDHLILVTGSKPWELQHTAAALRAAHGRDLSILLSFTSQKDAHSLRPLFGTHKAEISPWIPALWEPSNDVLLVYDALLRPVFEKILGRTEQLIEQDLDTEPELIKEENL